MSEYEDDDLCCVCGEPIGDSLRRTITPYGSAAVCEDGECRKIIARQDRDEQEYQDRESAP